MSKSGNSCSVAVCKNYHRKTKNRPGSPVSYYRFPRDPEIRQKWINQCKRVDLWNPNTQRVCSDHFTFDQFEDDVEARIMGLKRPKKLKPDAVPTRKLSRKPTPEKKRKQIATKSEGIRAKAARKNILNLLSSERKNNESHSEDRDKDESSIDSSLHVQPQQSTSVEFLSKVDDPDTQYFSDDPQKSTSSMKTEPSPSSICDTCHNLSVGRILQENQSLMTQVKELEEKLRISDAKLKAFEVKISQLEDNCSRSQILEEKLNRYCKIRKRGSRLHFE